MKKSKEKSKIKLIVIPAIIIILIGIAVLAITINKKRSINSNMLETKNYTVKYDTTWKIKENTDTHAKLIHDTDNGQIDIEVTNLEEKYQYSELDELIDEIVYSTNKNNANYKLLKKEEKNLTKKEYPGYKLLYENDENQVIISIFKVSDKLVTITYEAENTYFDIILDSVNTIIYNFELKEENLDLSRKINIETKKIEYTESNKLDNILAEKTEHEIADKNFYVTYSLPSNFEQTDIDSTLGYFTLNDFEEERMNISTSVYTYNIYEVLGDTARMDMLSEYKYNKDEKDFEETLSQIEKNGYTGYIYKNKYYKEDILNEDNERIYENVKIIYSLNANHIFVITIQSSEIGISEKLLDMIEITSSKNYASYIKSEKENGNIISTLKKYVDYSKEKTEEIEIKVPEKYKEQDTKQNIYKNRKYVINYNEDIEEYDYEIEFETTTLDINQIIDTENRSLSTAYGEANQYAEAGEKNINNKTFTVFNGKETKRSGIMYTDINRKLYTSNKKILFYKIDTGYLIIKITGNEKEITDEILNEAINFNVEIK